MGKKKGNRPRNSKGQFTKITGERPQTPAPHDHSSPASQPDLPESNESIPRSVPSISNAPKPSVPPTPDPLAPTGPLRRQLFKLPRHPFKELVIDPARPPKVYTRQDRVSGYPPTLLGSEASRITKPAIPYSWHPQSQKKNGHPDYEIEHIDKPEITADKPDVPVDKPDVPVDKPDVPFTPLLKTQFTEYREPLVSSSFTSNNSSPVHFQRSPSISVRSLIANLDSTMETPGETSQQGAQRQASRQNPTGSFGGDARMPQQPQQPQSQQPPLSSGPQFPDVYTHADRLRDAALILEIADEMGRDEYPELVHSLSDEHVNLAHRLLEQFSSLEIDRRRVHAIPRIDRVTKSIRSFDNFVMRFSVGPSRVSPTHSSVSGGQPRYNQAVRSNHASPAATPRLSPKRARVDNDYEMVERELPHQTGWVPNSQPMEPNLRPPSRANRNRDHRQYQERQDTRSQRYSSERPQHAPQLKIEHQIFVYHDTEPVTSYLSKLDHLVHRVGESTVLDHLGIGILLDGKSAGAKWFLALSTADKASVSTDYALFKKTMKKRFGKDRNTMMQKGDSLKHSFENEDKFSVNDYIDEKVRWYNEAGSLSEDWQALRVYNGLDDHLKVRITMKQIETNTIEDLRNQVAEHREAAYEEFTRRRDWRQHQEKATKDNFRQIQEVKNMLLSRQSQNINADRLIQQLRRQNNDATVTTVTTPVSVSPQVLDTLKKIPVQADRGNNQFNNPNRNRNNWNRNNWNRDRNANGTNTNQQPQNTNPQKQSSPAPPQADTTEKKSANILTIQGQTYLIDNENAYEVSDDNFADILEQINEFQPEDAPMLPPSATPEPETKGETDDISPKNE